MAVIDNNDGQVTKEEKNGYTIICIHRYLDFILLIFILDIAKNKFDRLFRLSRIELIYKYL